MAVIFTDYEFVSPNKSKLYPRCKKRLHGILPSTRVLVDGD